MHCRAWPDYSRYADFRVARIVCQATPDYYMHGTHILASDYANAIAFSVALNGIQLDQVYREKNSRTYFATHSSLLYTNASRRGHGLTILRTFCALEDILEAVARQLYSSYAAPNQKRMVVHSSKVVFWYSYNNHIYRITLSYT